MITERRTFPSDKELSAKAPGDEHFWFLLVQRDQDMKRAEMEEERIQFEAGVMEQMDELPLEPVLNRPDLVAVPVYEAIKHWPVKSDIDPKEFMVFPSDSSLRKSKEVSESTGIPLSFGAKTLVVAVNDGVQPAVLVVPGDAKADFEGAAKSHLDADHVSLAPRRRVKKLTGMETGSITPIGMREGVPVVVDDRLPKKEKLLMGSGLRKSKLIVPGAALLELPNVFTVMALGRVQNAA